MCIRDSNITDENTAVYDVELMVSKDGGASWQKATEENFPADGLLVTLPYPDGTDNRYIFTVVHMFTVGEKAGTTEKPEVKNTSDGIQFTVTSLSPVVVGYQKKSSASSGSGVSTYAIDIEKAEHGKVLSLIHI